MQISLEDTKVESLEIKQIDGEIDSDNFTLTFGTSFGDDLKTFLINFNLSLQSTDGFSLTISYVAFFATDEEIDEVFKSSHFVKANAPAIAYPFLRSFISTVTVNAGFRAVLIPTVNFQALSKLNTKEEI